MDEDVFLSRGERVQIAIAKIDQRHQALAGLKVRAKDASSSGKPMRKTDSGTDHRSNIAVGRQETPGVALVLQQRRLLHKRKSGSDRIAIKRSFREEIEINRSSMP